MRRHYVYSVCNGGHGLYLQQDLIGTRAQCKAWVKARARAGGHTATTFISVLGHDAASRRYMKSWR